MPVDHLKDPHGLDILVLREPMGASAVIHLYSGQVTSWKNSAGEELLFLSSKSNFKPPKPIRGGISICFPQAKSLRLLHQMGMGRGRVWRTDPNPPPPPTNGVKAYVDLLLQSIDEKTRSRPQKFELRVRVALGAATLTLTPKVRNVTDSKPLSFTFALHTYLSVLDISEVRVEGLETQDYFDNLQNKQRFTEQGDALTFDEEMDRVYLNTPTKIAVIDHEKKRTFVLKKMGFPDAVVWNPWDKKIRDLGDGDYKRMVCVEAALVENPITLKPGEEWKGKQQIGVVLSSYSSGHFDANYKVNFKT